MSEHPSRVNELKPRPCAREGCPRLVDVRGWKYCTVCGYRLRARMAREGYLTPDLSRRERFRRKSYLPAATLADDATAGGEDAIRALEDG